MFWLVGVFAGVGVECGSDWLLLLLLLLLFCCCCFYCWCGGCCLLLFVVNGCVVLSWFWWLGADTVAAVRYGSKLRCCRLPSRAIARNLSWLTLHLGSARLLW